MNYRFDLIWKDCNHNSSLQITSQVHHRFHTANIKIERWQHEKKIAAAHCKVQSHVTHNSKEWPTSGITPPDFNWYEINSWTMVDVIRLKMALALSVEILRLKILQDWLTQIIDIPSGMIDVTREVHSERKLSGFGEKNILICFGKVFKKAFRAFF